MSRSGSEKRQTPARIFARCTTAQKEAVQAIADSHGLSLGALFLKTLLGVSPARARRVKINDKVMARWFSENAKMMDVLKAILAELGKSGANVNQIAHYLHAGRTVDRLAASIEHAAHEHVNAVQAVEEAVRDVLERRTLGMQALGRERGIGRDD